MRSIFVLLAFLLIFGSTPVFGAWKVCNSDMVDAGRAISGCSNVGQMVFRVTGKAADMRDARAGLCRDYGYPEKVECTQAMVDDGDCLTSHLGTQVGNPMSCGKYSTLWLKGLMFRSAVGAESSSAAEAARKTAKEAAEARLAGLLADDE